MPTSNTSKSAGVNFCLSTCPPKAPKHEHVETWHGFEKRDDYHWLRAENWQEVMQNPKALPEDVLENLFKPMLLKAKSGAVERAKKYAKTQDELLEIIQQLKIRNYIR